MTNKERMRARRFHPIGKLITYAANVRQRTTGRATCDYLSAAAKADTRRNRGRILNAAALRAWLALTEARDGTVRAATAAGREYLRLFRQWERANYIAMLCPSLDRIDSDRTYVLGNVRFVPQWRNASMARRRSAGASY